MAVMGANLRLGMGSISVFPPFLPAARAGRTNVFRF